MRLKNFGGGLRVLFVNCAPDEALVRLAQQIISAQDASNLCGIAMAFAEAMKVLLNHPQNRVGTDWANQHPIAKLWIDKCCHLANMPQDLLASNQYRQVQQLSEGKTIEFGIRLDEMGWRYWSKHLEEKA